MAASRPLLHKTMSKRFGFEGPPRSALDAPDAGENKNRIEEAAQMEQREVLRTREQREGSRRAAHVLDNADLESLLAVIREVDAIVRLEQEAAAILDRETTHSPEFERTLLSPQSPDKHAEGPLVEDHLRLMLMYVRAIASGKVRLHQLPEFESALRALAPDDQEYVRAELTRVEDDIKKNSERYEVFALYHDVAKPDTAAFVARDKKPVAAEDYCRLLREFTDEHPELLREPSRLQEEFFRTHGLSVTNYRHGEVGVLDEHLTQLRAALDRRHLGEGEQLLMERAIKYHLEPHQRFVNGPDGGKFRDLLKKFEGLPREPREVARQLRIGALLDVLGTKRIAPDGTRQSDVRLTVNFILSERAHDALLAEEQKIAAYKAACREVGMTAEWLINSLGLRERAIGEAQRAVEAAVHSGQFELPPHLELYRDELESKVQLLRERLISS